MNTVLDQGNRTFIGSVVFLDIVGYTKKSVSEQIAMKDRFTGLLSEALKDIAAHQRIILDTGDGAAITFLGDPEDALFVAMHIRDRLKGHDSNDESGVQAGLPLRIGINLGPVKLIRDINGQPNIVGDGINVAQRIMSFSPAGKIVVSRSYYDVVSVISEEYSTLFNYDGSRTDKHVRDHEIYSVGESAAAFKQAKDGMTDRAAATSPRLQALQPAQAAPNAEGQGVETGGFAPPPPPGAEVEPGQEQTQDTEQGPAPDRKKFAYAGGVLAAIVVVLALALLFKSSPEKPGKPADAASAPAATAGTVPASSMADSTKAAVADNAPAKTAAEPPTPKPVTNGSLALSIQPWGEVFVNGKSIGVSPPLKQTKLAPGKYRIEIRNAEFPPYMAVVDVKSNETARITHKF